MNNSKIAVDTVNLELEEQVDFQPQFRKQVNENSDILEALEKVQSSNYWKLLEKTIFSVDLTILRTKLSREKDPIEIYRLQGEIARCEKYDLSKLILEKRNQLTKLKKQLHD